MESPSAPARPRPRSLLRLFFVVTSLALQGFGGVLAILQNELVDRRRWLTKEEFIEDWAVAQIMPGSNIVNFSLILGARYFGVAGALVALAGMLAAPLGVLLILAALYTRYGGYPGVAGAMRGMGAVAAGLIAATGLKLLGTLRNNPLGVPVSVALGVLCFTAVALLRWPLVYVLLGLCPVAYALTYRRLKP